MEIARYIIGFISVLLAFAGAAAPLQCVVCRQKPKEPPYLFGSAALRERVPVCKSCAQLSTTCCLCGLPVKTNFVQLSDGRFLCEQEAPLAIVSELEALRVFEDTKREMFRLFAGTGVLPSRNLSVRLVDGNELARLHQSQRSLHEQSLTMGLTRTRHVARNEFEHQIFLLSGLTRSRLLAVCAHEYTHTWLHENVPAERQLNPNTVEGFCELAAYQLMRLLGEDVEQRVILANNYSRGQINSLVRAAKEHEFYRVVEWIKTGQDGSLPPNNTSRLLVLNEPPAPVLFPWAQPLPPIPEALVLKGISGPARRRFALINGRTLEKNEEVRVRVGTSNVIVRCLDISDRSVLISVNGSVDKTELFLHGR